MYDPDGGPVSLAARDYCYENYTTDYERENKIETIIAIIFWFILLVKMVICVFDIVDLKGENNEF